MPLLFNTIVEGGSSSQSNQIRKRNKGIHVGKEVKPFLPADDMIMIYIPKESTKRLLELINSENFQHISPVYKNQFMSIHEH